MLCDEYKKKSSSERRLFVDGNQLCANCLGKHKINLASADAIDILLGADVYARILCNELRKGTELQPVAQKTIFGWILLGKIKAKENDDVTTHQCTVNDSLSTLIRSFWEQEKLPRLPLPLTAEEQECEDLFVRTHTRNADGRYVVRLLVRATLPDLSKTRTAAIRSLFHQEKRFLKDKQFHKLYEDFMDTYETLNHMSKLNSDTTSQGGGASSSRGAERIEFVHSPAGRLQWYMDGSHRHILKSTPHGRTESITGPD
ncbi:hypothetical protein RF55_12825 [Lasius niger]|uniref:Peptidase aspartic putative domain-containing protein n=1 Tax=Lasius niger TaxID=67767 RepID=A0A0J7KC39_LASNI|nr:hypothetical protein RF55_12825 [Lasius niger]